MFGNPSQDVLLSALFGNPVPVPTVTPGVPQPPAPPRESVPAGGSERAAREALGSQFAFAWFSSSRVGWDVGLAPGVLDEAGAIAAITEHLRSNGFTDAQTQYLLDRLMVVDEPFGEAELATTRDQVAAALQQAGFNALVSPQCVDGAYRVRAEVYSDTAPETIAAIADALAPFGDRVRFAAGAVPPHTLVGTVPCSPQCVLTPPAPPAPAVVPAPKAAPPTAPSIRRYVVMPSTSRCLRSSTVHLRLTRKTSAAVASVKISTPGHRQALSPKRPAKTVAIRLSHHRTRVAVKLVLKSGQQASSTVTFTRCGS